MRVLVFLFWGSVLSASGLDCLEKGCLKTHEGSVLTVYFRGHVRGFGGSPGRIPRRNWISSARQLLLKNPYALIERGLTSHLFATGSSHLFLTPEEIQELKSKTRAKTLFLASHSGGYVGLRETLKRMSPSQLNRVVGVMMLDNFYSPAGTVAALKDSFSDRFLNENCFGFTTPHNLGRYKKFFKELCPRTRHLERGHHVSGLRCMERFERGEDC